MAENKERSVFIDPLLYKIRRKGWSERLASQFEKQYGQGLRWRIVLQMEKLGLLQSRVSPERINLLSTRRLELFENTLSDLWVELLDGMVSHYLEGVEGGKIHQGFLPYLNGVIRHLVIANARSLGLLGKETPAEIMRSICNAKQEKTRCAKLAWAKFCFEHEVRLELLQCCSSKRFDAAYRNIHRVVDYFFERFIPKQCAQLPKFKGNILGEMLGLFVSSDSEFEEALKFIGTVTPFGAGEEIHTPRTSGVSDDEFLSALQQASQRGWL